MQMSFRLWLESAAGGKLYVRLGGLVGASETKLGRDFDRRSEPGMSVYEARRLSGDPVDWHIDDIRTYRRIRAAKDLDYYELVFPDRRQAIYSVGGDYWDNMFSQFSSQGRKIYLVTGEPVRWEMSHPEREGTFMHEPLGADGEPVLELDTVKVVKELEPWQILVGGRLADEYGGWHYEDDEEG